MKHWTSGHYVPRNEAGETTSASLAMRDTPLARRRDHMRMLELSGERVVFGCRKSFNDVSAINSADKAQ